MTSFILLSCFCQPGYFLAHTVGATVALLLMSSSVNYFKKVSWARVWGTNDGRVPRVTRVAPGPIGLAHTACVRPGPSERMVNKCPGVQARLKLTDRK